MRKTSSIADAIPHTPTRQPRYRCFADACPMAGTIFQGSPDGPGTCAFHFGAAPLDIARITRTLQDWRCLADAIQSARRDIAGQYATDASHQLELMARAWDDLRAQLDSQWWSELAPGPMRVRDHANPEGYRTLAVPEGYGDWARRLERFLGARVVEARTVNAERRARSHSLALTNEEG